MVFPYEAAEALVAPIGAALGFPADRIKYIGCILLAYPLGYAMQLIPGRAGRHLYSILIGVLMLLICFDLSGLLHFLAGPTLVYGLMQVLPSRLHPGLALVVMLGHLSYLHVSRMLLDWMGYSLDVTTAVMVSVIKVTMLAWNYRDGKTAPDLLHPHWHRMAVTRMPTPLEFYSYLLYFPTFLAGPAFHFATYREFISGKLFVDPKANPKGVPPSSLLPALRVFLEAALCLVVHVILGKTFPIGRVFEEGSFSGSFILWPMVYLYVALIGVRCQYYFAWKLSEGAGILSGLGFSGYDKEGKIIGWERLTNCYVLKIEFAGSVRDITIFWNFATAEWLKNYVYLRCAESPQAKVPTWAMYLTNTVSAFWHGFYPGYYLAFIKASIEIDIFRRLRTKFRPLVTRTDAAGKETGLYPLKHAYDLVGWVLQAGSFACGMGMFVGLSWQNSWAMAKNLAFVPFLGTLVAQAVVSFFPHRHRPRPGDKPKAQ